jgi:citrate lyase gamma subunit
MLDKQFYVYVHMKATDDSVFYVGKGCKYRYTTKQGRNQYWNRIAAKHGFVAEIVKSGLSFEEANAYEIELIKQLRDQGCVLCNLTDGGEGCLGTKKTAEQKAAISEKNKGRKWSEESKAKMQGNKNSAGAVRSSEVKAKMSASKKGWNGKIGSKVPEDVKDKIRATIKQTLAAKKLAKQAINSAINHKDAENA